ncbi:MAG: CoA transferase [Rhodospirillales bacterium]|nr:CoA transferase [Rhodospirillales bacterium]
MTKVKIFAGVRVVELGQYVMVPSAGAMLADFGAEVIKVETPGAGDPYRSLVVDVRGAGRPNFSLEQNNRGKKSIALDLKAEAGQALFYRLIETADVFLTSLRPGALRRMGLDVETLRKHNPKIIYGRANGLGFKGAEADKPGFDASAFWARGGFADLLTPKSGEFIRQPRALGDHSAAMSLAFGIAATLFRRATTGEPSLIETSLLATAAWVLSNDLVASQERTQDADVQRRAVERNPLVGTYRTRDGRWIQLVFLEPQRYWPGLCEALGRPELAADPRFADAKARAENGIACLALLTEIFAGRDWPDWQGSFEGLDAPWELVRSINDVFADPQTVSNGHVFDVDMADGGTVKLVATPVTVDGTPQTGTHRAPDCGQHTDALLAEYGIPAGEIAALKRAGVVA